MPLIELLADYYPNYRFVAPDARGVNKTTKFNDVEQYLLKYISHDFVQLIDFIHKVDYSKPIHLIAHDVSAVAWEVANDLQDKITSFIPINAPQYTVNFKGEIVFFCWPFNS